jgi:hypothetical protein
MALQCKCGQPIEAFGVPDCYTKMAPIFRFIFTTRVNSYVTSPSVDLALSPSNTTYPDIYKLITPRLDDVSSERAEPVTEEIGATQYYVRDAVRTITATVGQLPTEWGEMIAQLRCQSNLGVFFVDANGTVWGRKVAIPTGDAGAPIPVIPSTINALYAFPGYSTVAKYTISFQLPFNLADYEIIPLWNDKNILGYRTPEAVNFRVYSSGGNWFVRLFTKYHNPSGDIIIPINSVSPLSAIEIYDAAGSTLITTASAEVGNGVYQLGAALTLGTQYTLDCTGVASPTGFDWPSLRAKFTA